MIEVATGILILLASVFVFAGGLGVLRLPDVYIRMHAATKIGTLASMLVMGAVALALEGDGVLLRCALIVLFLFLTAPVGAHMVGRAALTLGVRPWGLGEGEAPRSWRPAPPPPAEEERPS